MMMKMMMMVLLTVMKKKEAYNGACEDYDGGDAVDVDEAAQTLRAHVPK